VNPNPSAVALEVRVVDTLFSCQPIDCELPRIAKSNSVPLVLLPGLSNDAKPPMTNKSLCNLKKGVSLLTKTRTKDCSSLLFQRTFDKDKKLFSYSPNIFPFFLGGNI